jgi:hypothetical protein
VGSAPGGELEVNWAKRCEEMLLTEHATPEQVKQFYTLPIRSQKHIVRNFDRKNKRQADPHRREKMKAARVKRNRQAQRNLTALENRIELQGILDDKVDLMIEEAINER